MPEEAPVIMAWGRSVAAMKISPFSALNLCQWVRSAVLEHAGVWAGGYRRKGRPRLVVPDPDPGRDGH